MHADSTAGWQDMMQDDHDTVGDAHGATAFEAFAACVAFAVVAADLAYLGYTLINFLRV